MGFPVFLSIDWDFAITIPEEGLTWDWFEAREDGLRNLVWHHRLCNAAIQGINPVELTPLAIDPKTWWAPFADLRQSSDCHLTVSESHVLAYEHITSIIRRLRIPLEVWQFDAHADLGYGKRPPSRNQPRVNAEDWLGTLIKSEFVYRLIQNYPSHAQEAKSEWPEKWGKWYRGHKVIFRHEADRAPLKYVQDELQDIEIAGVHICRSGAWSPPYFDEAFIEFVHSCPIGGEPEVMGLDYMDPMQPRPLPTDKDIESYRNLMMKKEG